MEIKKTDNKFTSSNCRYILDPKLHASVASVGNITSQSSTAEICMFVNESLVYQESVSSFANKLNLSFERGLKVLIEVIKSLKSIQDYNSTYIAYLSDQLSEEEFYQEAERFSYTPAKSLTPELLRDIKTLFSLTKMEFTPAEIADIFKLEHETSEEAINSLNLKAIEG